MTCQKSGPKMDRVALALWIQRISRRSSWDQWEVDIFNMNEYAEEYSNDLRFLLIPGKLKDIKNLLPSSRNHSDTEPELD